MNKSFLFSSFLRNTVQRYAMQLYVIQRRRLLILLSGVVLILFGHTPAVQTAQRATVQITGEVAGQLATTGDARVLILLQPPVTAAGIDRTAAIHQRQQQVLEALAPTEFQLHRQYQTVPALAGIITTSGVTKLRTNTFVQAIQLDHPGAAHLDQSLPALGGDLVHQHQALTGQGVTVAVLDSGIDTDHPDLADALVAQHCFVISGSCPPDSRTEGMSAEDANGHGTHVAGVITANGVVASSGFAPNARIVAIRVLDAAGSGYVSDWVAGLDWVQANLATTRVQLINMSLGTFQLYAGNCDLQEPLLAIILNLLRAQGITLFASSGNQGSATHISAPACNGSVIAVGATYDGDVGRQPTLGTYRNFGSQWPECADTTTGLRQITCFTNSNGQLDILAPGAPIQSTFLGGGTATFWGTSQASPTAAGIAALLLEQRPSLTPSQIKAALIGSGPAVVDIRNGRQFPLIHAYTAIQAMAAKPPMSVTLAGPTTGTVNQRYTFTATTTPLTVTTPLTYSWQIVGQPSLTRTAELTDAVELSWSTPGHYTVAVQASNRGGTVSASREITITAYLPVAPAAVAVGGAVTGSTGLTHTYTAAVVPLSTTLPITYIWQTPAHAPVVHTSQTLTDRVALRWDTPGQQPITVTAANQRGVVTMTFPITIQDIAPQQLTLQIDKPPKSGMPVQVQAQLLPVNASLPITYTWQATEQPPIVHTATTTDVVSYQWTTGGVVTLTVRAENRGGVISQQATIEVDQEYYLYLPVVPRP